MIALKIQFDVETGRRAGDIDPRDPGLRARGAGWQMINRREPGECWEIREVLDDRDVEKYRAVEGVEVLEGRRQVEEALAEIACRRRSTYRIDRDVVLAYLSQKGQLERLRGKTLRDAARELYEDGVPGIRRVQPAPPRL